MTKKKQKKYDVRRLDKNVKAEHYTPSMVDFLGYETVKDVYDATLTAIEEAQHFSAEVREKGLHTAGLLGALIVGLIAAICAVEYLFLKAVLIAVTIVLVKALRSIVRNVIYRKENAHRGNTQSRMLSEQMINVLHKVDKENRSAFVLASTLKSLEKSAEELDRQTEKKQEAYQREIDTLTTLLAWIFGLASIFAVLFHFSQPVY